MDTNDFALVNWINRIPIDQILGIVVLLTARLMEENQKRSLSLQNSKVTGSGKLLTAGELGSYLNVPESWVRSEQRAGRIPTVRMGKYVRFRLTEVELALSVSKGTQLQSVRQFAQSRGSGCVGAHHASHLDSR
jgi:excisionase family DNA binding protein